MSHWPSSKARKVLAALLRIGWAIQREAGGSQKVLERAGWSDVVFAFHEAEEIGPRMLKRIAKRTELTPDDFYPAALPPCATSAPSSWANQTNGKLLERR
ncbi:MAG: type II toxin-antitoxin system HicA family toxin [Pirellulaceae bacterium]|nr:type II toxin-antitoxin system HicA family toxin [Pirellulaceae bacterium]